MDHVDSVLQKPRAEWVRTSAKFLREMPEHQHAPFLKALFKKVTLIDPGMLKALVEGLCRNREVCSPLIQGLGLLLEFREYLNVEGEGSGHRSLQPVVERILDAALSVFSKRGYHEATMEEIAQVAGVGKGTLYRYFKSKDELYHALLEVRLKGLDDEIQQIINSPELDVVDTIYRCFQVYLRFFEHYRGLYRLILREWKAEEHGIYIKRALRRLYPLKKKIFEATRSGIFKPLHFETTFYGFMGFLHGIVQKWLDHGCDYSLLDDLPVASEILLYGVITEKEREKLEKQI